MPYLNEKQLTDFGALYAPLLKLLPQRILFYEGIYLLLERLKHAPLIEDDPNMINYFFDVLMNGKKELESYLLAVNQGKERLCTLSYSGDFASAKADFQNLIDNYDIICSPSNSNYSGMYKEAREEFIKAREAERIKNKKQAEAEKLLQEGLILDIYQDNVPKVKSFLYTHQYTDTLDKTYAFGLKENINTNASIVFAAYLFFLDDQAPGRFISRFGHPSLLWKMVLEKVQKLNPEQKQIFEMAKKEFFENQLRRPLFNTQSPAPLPTFFPNPNLNSPNTGGSIENGPDFL